jgi:hypothetical protein
VTAVCTIFLGWLSRAPYDPPGSDGGLLRLSWRLRGEKVETCRPRTQAELDALPVHMRTPEVCESRRVAYRLVVQLDGHAPDTTIVLPGGARADRPVYVLRETPLAPGPHRVLVTFTGLSAHDDAPQLSLEADLDARPGRVELITLDPEGHRLVHVRTSRAAQ